MNLYNVTIYIYIYLDLYIFIYFNLQTVQGSFLPGWPKPTEYLCNVFDSLHLLVPKNTIYI